MLQKVLPTLFLCFLLCSLNAQINCTKNDSTLIRECTQLPSALYPELDTATALLKLCLSLEWSLPLPLIQSYIYQINNAELYYTTGLIYFQQQQVEIAIKFLEIAHQKGQQQALAIQSLLYFQNDDYQKASEIIQRFSKATYDNIHCWSFFYLKALNTLLYEDKNDAFKRLKAVHAQSPYKASTEKLLQHFFPILEE